MSNVEPSVTQAQPPASTGDSGNPAPATVGAEAKNESATIGDVERILDSKFDELLAKLPGAKPGGGEPPKVPEGFRLTEDKAREMMEAAAQKVLDAKGPSLKPPDTKEPEKTPISIPRLRKLLWGGEEK